MEIKYFSLGEPENNQLVKILKIIFGVVCITVALFWLRFNFTALKTSGTIWITIIFLSGFGLYLIWAGLGHANRFIEFAGDTIRLKKNAILQTLEIKADSIERIDVFPLNVIFFLKSEKRILLRLGTSFHDQNELILDEIVGFAENNSVPFEVIEEKI